MTAQEAVRGEGSFSWLDMMGLSPQLGKAFTKAFCVIVEALCVLIAFAAANAA